MTLDDAPARRDAYARAWSVTIERTVSTESSLIAYGRRADQPVVLKVVRKPGDEWRSGEIVNAFNGRGMARGLAFADGAMLLERLEPADSLSALAVAGRDDEATAILARVMAAMNAEMAPAWCPTAHDWGRGFARYRMTGDQQVPRTLVDHAERIYLDLCATQRAPRLLHGDLQHYNVRFDHRRGWTAIDPKGVIAEPEYELGAFIRNPAERPSLFTDTTVVRSRLQQITAALGLDFGRALAWSYAQAVLSAIWGVEDGYRVDASAPTLILACAIRPLVG